MSTAMEAPATALGADSLPVDILHAIVGPWADRDPYEISGALPEGQMEAECRICGRRRLVSVNWSGSLLKCTRCDRRSEHIAHYPPFLVDKLLWRLAMLERAGFRCMLMEGPKAARLRIEITDDGAVKGWFGVHPSLSPTAFIKHLRFIWNAVVEPNQLSATYDYRRDDEVGSWWYGLTWELKPEDVLI